MVASRGTSSSIVARGESVGAGRWSSMGVVYHRKRIVKAFLLYSRMGIPGASKFSAPDPTFQNKRIPSLTCLNQK